MGINNGKLLKPGTVQLLQTAQRLASGEQTGYGLGWELETLPLAGQPTRMVGHGSKEDFIGGTTDLMTFPERGLAVAVMANISFADTKSIAMNIAQAFAKPGLTSHAMPLSDRPSLRVAPGSNRPQRQRPSAAARRS